MNAMASQITGVSVVHSTVCPGADQIKHQSSASLAFVRGIHRSPVNSPHKCPVTRKMIPFDVVIMRTHVVSFSVTGQSSGNLPFFSKWWRYDKKSCRHYWTLARAIHRSRLDSPQKYHNTEAFSFLCFYTEQTGEQKVGDLRRLHAHVTSMYKDWLWYIFLYFVLISVV